MKLLHASQAPPARTGLRRREGLAGAAAWALAGTAWAHAPASAPLLPAVRDEDAQLQLALCRRVFEALARWGEPLPASDLQAVQQLAARGPQGSQGPQGPAGLTR